MLCEDLRQYSTMFVGARAFSCRETHTLVCTSGCLSRTGERERERELDFVAPFYMLFWSHHLSATRCTILKVRDVILTDVIPVSRMFCSINVLFTSLSLSLSLSFSLSLSRTRMRSVCLSLFFSLCIFLSIFLLIKLTVLILYKWKSS